MKRYTDVKQDSNLTKYIKDKEHIKMEQRKLRNMHPKELTKREKLLRELNKEDVISPKEQIRDILDKYSKVNDGSSFKAKFYNILEQRIHQDKNFKLGNQKQTAI